MRGVGLKTVRLLKPRRMLLAAVALCLGTSGAVAQGGIFDFFGNAFVGDGGGEAPPAAEIPQPGWIPSDAPPLTVRKRRKHTASSGHAGSIRYNIADLKGITMYTDKTLSRGDAVMTPSGLKVYVGSGSGPHTDDDFVALSESGRIAKDVRRELVAIDTASRPAFQR